MEAYHTAKRGSREQTRKAPERFHRAFDMMERGGPFMEDSEFDHKMLHILRREVEHLMLRPPHHEEPEPEKPPARRKKPPTPPSGAS